LRVTAGFAVAACLAFWLSLRHLDALTERSRGAYDSTIGFGLAPRARHFRPVTHRTNLICTDSGMLAFYDGDRIT
jgi:hypothetical protein